MSDVFEEVEEGVLQDRLQRFWRRYGGVVIAALVVVLAGVGGWRLYEGWSVDQARQHSTDFVSAQKLLHDGKAKEAGEQFTALQSRGPAVYRDLAKMEAAAAKAGNGDLQGALAGFDAAAASAKDPVVRDTARLRAAYIAADTQDFAAVQARLQPMIAAGGPSSYLARELLGVEAFEAGQFNLARETFQSLSDAFQTPDSVRQRAQLALSVLGPAAPEAAAPGRQDSTGATRTQAPAAPGGDTK